MHEHQIIVTGTDTDIGKTVFAAGLTVLLDAVYWKPIQAGLNEETDSETVSRLTGLPPDRILPEAWRLRTPASPHLAAALDSKPIDSDALAPPTTGRPLVIEWAGGLLVPLTRATVFVDVFARCVRQWCFAPVRRSAPSTTRSCRSRRCASDRSLFSVSR